MLSHPSVSRNTFHTSMIFWSPATPTVEWGALILFCYVFVLVLYGEVWILLSGESMADIFQCQSYGFRFSYAYGCGPVSSSRLARGVNSGFRRADWTMSMSLEITSELSGQQANSLDCWRKMQYLLLRSKTSCGVGHDLDAVTSFPKCSPEH